MRAHSSAEGHFTKEIHSGVGSSRTLVPRAFSSLKAIGFPSHRAQAVPPSLHDPARKQFAGASRRARGPAALDRSCSVCSCSRARDRPFFTTPPETSGGHVFRRLASCARPSAVVRNGPQRSARARTCRPPIQQLVLRTDAQVPCLCPSDPVAILYALARRVHVLSAIVRSRPHSSTPVRTCQPRNAPFDARCVWVVARRLSRRPNALPVFTAS